MAATNIVVSAQTAFETVASTSQRPSHHTNDTKSHFTNPWDSYATAPTKFNNILTPTLAVILERRKNADSPLNVCTVQVRRPTWGKDSPASKIKATWLGHACFLVELPTPPGAIRGPRILFDPVFCNRVGPFEVLGPARFTPIPCEIEEITDVDVVAISHNHYDHMDNRTLKLLHHHQRKPHFFVPLGNTAHLESLQIPSAQIHSLDWWESRKVSVTLPSAVHNAEPVTTSFTMTCTPSQHTSARAVLDRAHTLWSSWAIDGEGIGGARSKVWFAGDTGYRRVKDGDDEDKVPVCPAFKEIGEKFGGFDLALIPIGAYLPREMMSGHHCAPQDSVRVFKDVRAKRAIAMHWGTWILTSEPIMEPPIKLREECKKLGISDEEFVVCDIGETLDV